MFKRINIFLHDNKSRIGLFHGFISCIGALVLAFLTSMLLSIIIDGDYAQKIVPSMILTPILMVFYGIWLLLSNTRYVVIKKVILSTIIFTSLIFFIQKVF